jgi:hypothetical protein
MSNTAIEANPLQTAQARQALKATDRCDTGNCFAQAYVRVELADDLDLLFCGHHYHKAEAGLAGVALHVQDERHELLPKPFDPATDNS